MEEQKYRRAFPGCMKGLVHFLDLHHHLHLRKMKMLAYRNHDEGKRAARKKEPKTDPDAPSTSHQYVCFEDTSFGEEDKVNIRKHQMKSSMRIFIPKWGLREDSKKRKVPPPASRLLRTFSIHHWREDHVDNMNFGVETLVIEQNVDVNKASSSSERVYILSRSSDEHIYDKQCDGNMAYCISGSFDPSPSDEHENILQMNQLHQSNILNEDEVSSFAQKDTNAKEQQEDVILYPSKEFLAMMKLFNGNTELIRNILDDPSFIFAHYLQDKQASNAELTRGYSFQAPWQLERKTDGQFGIRKKAFEKESLVKQSDKFLSEDLPTYTDKIEEDAPKEEMVDDDEESTPKHTETNTGSTMVAPWSTFQNVRINPPNSNGFMTMEHNKKEHHRIFMDGILHKIPFGRKVMEAMKRSKFGWWDGSNIKKPDGEGSIHSSWKKNNKHVKKSIQRSQSLNDSLDKYSHLYESIAKEEFKGLPKRMKVKSFGRLFSLPDIKYCPSSKKNHSEAMPFPSPKNLTTSHMEKIHEKEESKESTIEVSSKWTVIDCEDIPLRSNEKEQSESCQISKNLTEDGLTKEHRSITSQGEKLLDEAYAVSATWSLARGPSPSDEHENILQMNQLHQSNILNEAEVSSFAQKDTNAKEQQEDVILYPSKEFLAMMKLFNGNTELIQNILDDPSFIFAHYLQDKQASNAELTRGYSFQAPWQLERKNDGQFRVMQKKFENESLIKQSDKFLSEDLPTYIDKIEEDAPKEEMVDGNEESTPKHTETNTGFAMVAQWSTFQNVRINPPNSNRFMTMEHNKKEHHRIFMDRILHKIPFGRKVMEAMKRSKSGWWDGSNIKKPDGEGLIHSSWNKNNKHAKKSIQRSQSLNDSLDKYSHLYESIAKEEFKGLPKRMKVKSFGRLFSLPDIKYCPSSKKIHSEATPFSSPKNLTTSHMEKIHEKEESKESTTEVSSKWMAIDCENIPLQSSEKEQSESCQILKNLTEDGLTKEHRSITPQGEKLPDETYAVSATWSLARGNISVGFLDYAVSEDLEYIYPSGHSYLLDINAVDGLESNERDLAKSKSSPDIDFFDSLHLQMDQKEEAKFNFVRERLKRYGFSGSEFLEAWHSPYQPMDLLLFNEAEDLSYELDFSEYEHDMLLEHQLLFELINKALVETYEKFFASFFPWLSRFSTNTRPMPMGSHILKDLKDQPQLGIALEDTVFQNFTKNDGWMNIQFDIEDVVCELESLLLDALLDDTVLQLSLMPASNQISCSMLYMSVHPCLD